MKKINNITDISDQYETYIIDLFGVIHDGKKLYPNINDAILYLLNDGSNVIFLSNAPSSVSNVSSDLINLGMSRNILSHEKCRLMTSGDFFISQYDKSFHKKKMFIIGEDMNHDLIANIENIEIANNIDNADYLLILALMTDTNRLNIFDESLELAAKKSITALVPNPDINAPHGDGYFYTSGYFARKYENMGGKSIYYGKPYQPIYEYALNNAGIYSQNRGSILAIGDNAITDILGANNCNIDSLLTTDGLYKNKTEKEIQKIIEANQPTYITNYLKI